MSRSLIREPRGSWSIPPNVLRYDSARSAFSWEEAERRDHLALRWPGRGDRVFTEGKALRGDLPRLEHVLLVGEERRRGLLGASPSG